MKELNQIVAALDKINSQITSWITNVKTITPVAIQQCIQDFISSRELLIAVMTQQVKKIQANRRHIINNGTFSLVIFIYFARVSTYNASATFSINNIFPKVNFTKNPSHNPIQDLLNDCFVASPMRYIMNRLLQTLRSNYTDYTKNYGCFTHKCVPLCQRFNALIDQLTLLCNPNQKMKLLALTIDYSAFNPSLFNWANTLQALPSIGTQQVQTEQLIPALR
jgi:hypothetical protein